MITRRLRDIDAGDDYFGIKISRILDKPYQTKKS